MPRHLSLIHSAAAPMVRLSIIVPFHKNLDQLRRCLAAIANAAGELPREATLADLIVVADGAQDDPHEVADAHRATVLAIDGPLGPAAARNRGAAAATGDVLVFVDTDVVIAPDALGRFARLFAADPTLGAAFGAYDETPAEPGFLSQCRNLAHSFVHQRARREAQTFWAGLGAIRADAFAAVGGFDERFRRPSVEDIDLGYRVRAAGHRIALDPTIQGTHLKRWTFGSSIVTDVRDRGVPWTQLIRRLGVMHNDLNITHKYRACVVFAYVLVLTLAAALVQPRWLIGSALAAAMLWALDWSYYRYFARQRGWLFALRWFPFHVIHHLCNGVSFAAGTAVALVRTWTGVALPGALPLTPWRPSPVTRADAPARSRADRFALIGVCLLALGVGSIGITNDGQVLGHGDMPRYLMNGVYMLDVLADRPFSSIDALVEYTMLYFSRYPALSLGHHPPLTSALEVPFYALFGISVGAGRLVPLLSFVFATGFLYRLTRRIYDPPAGLLAALFFVTSPLIVQVSRGVLSEMPTIALLMGSAYYLHRFCETQRLRLLAVFALLAGLSLAAKQLALFVFPAFAVMAVRGLGIRRFLRRDVLIALVVMAVLSAPLVPLTLNLSRANVNWALLALTGLTGDDPALIGMVKRALAPQLGLPVLLLVALAIVNMLVRRDGRALPFIAWILGVWACVITAGRWDPPRYGIYWVPALAVVAASLVSGWRRSITTAIVCVAIVAAGLQARKAWRWSYIGISGYENAARYILAAKPGPTVLFNGSVDAGYFSFFMRKHDSARSTAVIRADKIFSTSFMNRSMEELIQSPAEIYPGLRQFGIRYIVSEDRPARSRALEWLRQEMRTPRFVERHRFRVDPNVATRGDLVIYEYLEATAPDRDAILSMNIPLISRRINVTLGDLIDRKYLR